MQGGVFDAIVGFLWPRTEEFEFRGSVYQVFERAILKWAREEAPPWDVHVALLVEALPVMDEPTRRGLLSGA